MNKEVQLREIPRERAKRMVMEYHYLNTLHPVNHHSLGGFIDGDLMGIMTLRWSIRPDLTIQKCFPELDRENYRLIGRLCTVENLPQNAESHFISKCIGWIKENRPELDVLYTWADGIMGKPGIVYQASNFWHGEYIWTETYLTETGERVHPGNMYPDGDISTENGGQKTDRPSYEELKEMNMRHIKAKQHRYVYFLSDEQRAKELRDESPMNWKRTDYPKQEDMYWKENTDEGWVEIPEPHIDNESFEYQSKGKDGLDFHNQQPELGAFTEGGQHWDRYECEYPPPYFETPTGEP